MVGRYAPRTKLRPGRGAVTLFKDEIAVTAPVDYHYANWMRDPTTRAGYFHAFLRPFRAVMAGFIPQPGFIVYPFVDAAPNDGLRCPGAVIVYRNPDRGFTLVFFPAMQKAPPDKSEVDHLSAHIDFDDGVIRIGEMHAKVRLGGEGLPSENLPLERVKADDRPVGFVKNDDHHLAFETWCKDVTFLDPAGSVEGALLWASRVRQNRRPKLRTAIESSVLRTISPSLRLPPTVSFLPELRCSFASDS